jgi:aryl-alcohol dehydrogenase-like predicted oxidoreductase
MLKLARRSGIDSLDTARGYGDSERILGELALPSSGWRIITKLSHAVTEGVSGKSEAAERTRKSVEDSLGALRLEQVDTLLLHRAIHRREYDGVVWDVLREYNRKGIIKRLGISAGNPDEAFEALNDPDIKVVQVASSLLDQRLWRKGFFETAKSAGVEIFIRSVFLQGVAFIPLGELPDYLKPLVPVMKSIHLWSKGEGMTLPDTFLLFARDAINGKTVIGCESLGQLQRNLDAWSLPMLSTKKIAELSGLVPELPDAILNPANWGKVN